MKKCEYSPQISPGNPNHIPIPTTGTTFVPRKTVLFTFDSTVLELEAPELGDVRSVKISKVQKYTRSNKLIIYRDNIWPRVKTFSWIFNYLTKAKALETLNFINLTLGEWVQVTDFNSVVFDAIITNPRNSFTYNSGVEWGPCEGRTKEVGPINWKCDLIYRVEA